MLAFLPRMLGDRMVAGPEKSHPADAAGAPRAIAERAIREALDADVVEVEPLARWRAHQIDQAIVLYLNGTYHEALTQALRARLPASEIPVAELSLTIHESVSQLRARLKALRDFFGSPSR
jgi:hypothetical protein